MGRAESENPNFLNLNSLSAQMCMIERGKYLLVAKKMEEGTF